jgi:hypothetical protein
VTTGDMRPRRMEKKEEKRTGDKAPLPRAR